MRNKFFKNVLRRGLVGCVAFLFVLFTASLSWASSIIYNIQGFTFNELTATVEMEYISGDTLEFLVTNTSVGTSFITGFAFNVPDDVIGILGFTAFDENNNNVEGGPPKWSDYFPEATKNKIGVNTPGPFGSFDLAAITGNTFGGGAIAWGIGIPANNNTYTFTFEFTGTDLGLLETSDFDILSHSANNNDDPQVLAVRFQGFNPNDESDIGITTVVPIPSAILLLGSGLLSLVGIRKKFIGRG